MSEGLRREWFSMNMHLGNRYVDSPINVYNEPESREQIVSEYQDAVNYTPSSRPGCRAPHVWLNDGRSTLDLFGRGFVMLVFDGQPAAAAPWREAARRIGVPLEIISIDEAAARTVYQKRYVLVRPDGHVTWRSDSMPEVADAILYKVTGHLRSINETVSL
jgi:hypothetical protein